LGRRPGIKNFSPWGRIIFPVPLRGGKNQSIPGVLIPFHYWGALLARFGVKLAQEQNFPRGLFFPLNLFPGEIPSFKKAGLKFSRFKRRGKHCGVFHKISSLEFFPRRGLFSPEYAGFKHKGSAFTGGETSPKGSGGIVLGDFWQPFLGDFPERQFWGMCPRG